MSAYCGTRRTPIDAASTTRRACIAGALTVSASAILSGKAARPAGRAAHWRPYLLVPPQRASATWNRERDGAPSGQIKRSGPSRRSCGAAAAQGPVSVAEIAEAPDIRTSPVATAKDKRAVEAALRRLSREALSHTIATSDGCASHDERGYRAHTAACTFTKLCGPFARAAMLSKRRANRRTCSMALARAFQRSVRNIKGPPEYRGAGSAYNRATATGSALEGKLAALSIGIGMRAGVSPTRGITSVSRIAVGATAYDR